MPYFDFLWTDDIVDHIAQHAVSQDDFEEVVGDPVRIGQSRSSGLPAAWGHTTDGRYIIAIYEQLDDVTVIPVTAYEVPDPQ